MLALLTDEKNLIHRCKHLKKHTFGGEKRKFKVNVHVCKYCNNPNIPLRIYAKNLNIKMLEGVNLNDFCLVSMQILTTTTS